jgi:hypothetical protein
VSRDTGGGRYVRAVEAAWSKVLGRPAVVSPREFEMIDAWRTRGVPLSIVLEVIASAGKRSTSRAPRALTRLNHAVLEAWEVVAAGRTGARPIDVRPARAEARRAWEDALTRAPAKSRLRDLLTGLLADEERGVEADALDAALDASLPTALSEDALKKATDETLAALHEFRDRMSEWEFRKMFSRALVDRLRRALSLPRLSLTR